MERPYRTVCQILRSHFDKYAGQLLSHRSPAPGEVTVLSPCSCCCLEQHASSILSKHLDDARCSGIISQTGESLSPLQMSLNMCYIPPTPPLIQRLQGNVCTGFAQIFRLLKTPLQRMVVKTLREGNWSSFIHSHPLISFASHWKIRP